MCSRDETFGKTHKGGRTFDPGKEDKLVKILYDFDHRGGRRVGGDHKLRK